MARITIPWSRWFPAMAERPVRIYMVGQASSMFGAWVLDITLNLLVWELTRSPGTLGLLNFLVYGPSLVLTPLWANSLRPDNGRRRALWLLGGLLGVAVALAAMVALGWMSVPAMLALALLRGILNAMEMPSRHMMLTSAMAQHEHIGGAIAINNLVFQVARMLGPSVAAVLFVGAGPMWGFVFAALATSVMLLCARELHPHARMLGPATPAGRQGMAGALDFVRADRFGRLFLPAVVCLGTLAAGYQTLIPVLADVVFGSAARWTSVFFACAGGGALAGALLLSTRGALWVHRRLLVPMCWLVALAMVLIGSGASLWLALPCFAVIGLGITTVTTCTSAELHRRVPQEARNGLIALILMAFNGTIPLSQLLAGALAQRLGASAGFQVLGAALLVACAALFVPRWRRLGRLETDPAHL